MQNIYLKSFRDVQMGERQIRRRMQPSRKRMASTEKREVAEELQYGSGLFLRKDGHFFYDGSWSAGNCEIRSYKTA